VAVVRAKANVPAEIVAVPVLDTVPLKDTLLVQVIAVPALVMTAAKNATGRVFALP